MMARTVVTRWLATVAIVSLCAWHGAGQAQTNLVQNPGFESGTSAWTENATGGLAIITNDASFARAGSWYAWLGGYVSGTDTLYQDITIPADAQQAQLRFWYRVSTNEASSSVAYDTFSVALVNPSTGAVLTTLASLSNLTPTSSWTQSAAYDVSSFRGTRVRLRFQATNDFSDVTNFLVDDVALTVTSAPPPAPTSANYSDIWWNPQESGWGLTVADHETQLFAVWYTYREDGSPTWFVIPGGNFSADRRTFTGDVYSTRGPAYNTSFNAAMVTTNRVGTASLDFAPAGFAAGQARFSYTIGAVSGTKLIERQPFGNAPPSWGTDFTDIWWDPSESGWGLTLAQHGNNVFAVWFTYDTQGRPLFVVMPGAVFSGPNSFSGDLYVTTGPYYGNPTFDASQVRATRAGTATISFDNAALEAKAFLPSGTFQSTVFGFPQVKRFVSQPFGNARAGACTVTLSPMSAAYPPSGGIGTVSVSTQAGCAWEAVSSDDWITLLARTGSGTGSLRYSVAQNSDSRQRSGHVSVLGAVHTISQTGVVTPSADVYSGPFDASGSFTRAFPEYGTSCTFSNRFHGTLSVTMTVENDQVTYNGTARVDGTWDSTATGGGNTSFTCLSSSTTWSDTRSISGRLPDVNWTTRFSTPGGSNVTGTVSGSVSSGLNMLTGVITFSIDTSSGRASAFFSLPKR